MKLTVVCFGVLRDHLPDPSGTSTVIEVLEGSAVSDVADALGVPVRLLHAVLVDGARAVPSTPVHDGAEVTLMPAFSGGAAVQEEQR